MSLRTCAIYLVLLIWLIRLIDSVMNERLSFFSLYMLLTFFLKIYNVYLVFPPIRFATIPSACLPSKSLA